MKIKFFFFFFILFCINLVFVFQHNTPQMKTFSPSLKWKLPLEEYSSNQVSGSLALDNKNNIYVTFAGSPGSSTAILVAFNPNGIKKWYFTLRNFSVSNPVIDENDNIYVLSSPSLYSISPNGELLWENEEFGNLCNLSLGTNQTLFGYDCSKGINKRNVWSILNNGSIAWSFPYENNSKITVDRDNNIFLFHIDRLRKENFLIKLGGKDGSLIWKYRIKDEITKSTVILISNDGSLVINLKPVMLSLNKDGTENWKINNYFSRNPPLIDTNGIIYSFNENDSLLYAINADGTTKWKKENGIVLPSFITENGFIHYFYAYQSNETFLRAINQDGIEQWFIPLQPNPFSPVISKDGTIYGFYDEYLVAYQGNSKLLPDGWPRLNRNNQNTNSTGEVEYKTKVPKNFSIEMKIGSKQALVNNFPFQIDPPFLYQNRTYIPFRFLGKFFEADIDFSTNETTKFVESVSYTTEEKCISLFINQTKGMINGNYILIDSPPIIKNNRTFLPLRFLSESLGADVFWDSKSQIIKIHYEE